MKDLPTIDINTARTLLAGSTDPVEQGTKLFETYGELLCIELGSTRIYCVFAPDLAQQVLEGEGFARRSSLVADFLRPLGSPHVGIHACNDPNRWGHDRTTAQLTLDLRAHPSRTIDTLVQRADAHLEQWRAEHDDGASFDVGAALDRLVVDVLLHAAFVRLGVESSTVARLIHDATFDLVQRAYAAEPAPWLLPTGSAPASERPQPLAEVHALARRVVGERLDGRDFDDLLGDLLHHHPDPSDRSRLVEQVADQLVAILGVGFSSTVSLLHWSLVALSRHPVVERTIAAELEAQLRGRPPSVEALPRLRTLSAFCQEVLRLWPGVIGVARQADGDQRLGEHTIVAGSTVVVGLAQLHRHPDWWPNPQGFDPERFLGDERADRHPYAYCPYGGGPRECLGRSFASTAAMVWLARMIPSVRVELLAHAVVGRRFAMPLSMRPDATMMRLRVKGS